MLQVSWLMAKLENLEIFQNGLVFVKDVYSITDKFPEKEKFNLTLHLNKSASPPDVSGRLRLGAGGLKFKHNLK